MKYLSSKIFILVTMLLLVACNSKPKNEANTSDKEYLKGLVKATEEDLAEKQFEFDGESIPVYDIEGKRIKGMEMMQTMMSGDYTPEFYMNAKKEIKVIALRNATEEEKMEEMQDPIRNESELMGQIAFPFSVTDINGNHYSLENLKGKIVVMNYWFVACKPCIMEMPELNELVKMYKNKNIAFLGFSTDNKSKIDLFLKKNEFTYDLIPSSKEIAATYNVSSFPTHIIIDENSNIVYYTRGLSPNTITDIEETIKSLIDR